MDIAAMRARANARCDATCRITRAGTGAAAVDDTTLAVTRPERDTVYEGPCLVGTGHRSGDAAERGGLQTVDRRTVVGLPVGDEVFQRGDVVEVLTVGPEGDPALVGVHLSVDEVVVRSTVILRRLHCIDTRTSPGRLP